MIGPDRSTAVLFGDGAGGVLLEAREEPLFSGESNSDGSRECPDLWTDRFDFTYFQFKKIQMFLRMDGRAVFDFAIRDVAKSINRL